jgi:hypothetical protein
MSVRPVCWPESDHSVSPWRTRYNLEATVCSPIWFARRDRFLSGDDCGLERLAQPATVSPDPQLGKSKADLGTGVAGDYAATLDIVAACDDGRIADQPCRDVDEIYLVRRAAAATSIFQPGIPILKPPSHIGMRIAWCEHAFQRLVITPRPRLAECYDGVVKFALSTVVGYIFSPLLAAVAHCCSVESRESQWLKKFAPKTP